MQPIQNRCEFVLLFDVQDGNPNGDPDAGNAPRIDPETGHGLVTDVCLKRKIRNYVCLAKTDPASGQPAAGYDIYVKEKAILNHQHERAYTALKLDPNSKVNSQTKQDHIRSARAWMCQTFFDIRMFGAVMSTEINCGQVRGPVQLAFARSIDPITALEQSITRMAVTTEQEAEKQKGDNRTMGRKEIIPYGLYRVHGFISPFLAQDTGFSEDDLAVFWQAVENMFEHDHSAARGEMAVRKLLVFEHETALGNAPSHRLFDLVKIGRKNEAQPPRAFTDYEVGINRSNLPTGVTLHERV